MNVLTVLCQGGWMSGHVSEGWRRLGAHVDEFFYGTHMGRDWSPEGNRRNRQINQELLQTARRMKAEGRLDLLFMIIYDDVLERDTARELRKLAVPMVNYHVDLVGQWHRVLRTGRYFDRVACAHKDHWKALQRAGIRPYYMPMAANPTDRHPLRSLAGDPLDSPPVTGGNDGNKFDGALYLGSPWEYRTKALSAIAAAGLPLQIYGHGWKTSAAQKFNFQPWQKALHDLRYYSLPFIREEGLGPVAEAVSRRFRRRIANEAPDHSIPVNSIRGAYDQKEFYARVAGAAINLGFTYFRGIPGTPGEERQVRLRDFEIPMAGGFYLTEDCPQLRELFEPGVHLAVWNGIPDLLEKIRHYLAHPEERNRIARAGRDHCEKLHSWESRFRQLSSELGLTLSGTVHAH